ncbi:hypothetical protein PVL29_021464 [Vitis rotundifolia]|uniref:PGG domain-containing protein n=1 Tax=Vitis rotundifolia TaxID=103349 RepID=A0AA39DC44_VITRO|nr:hypothetical protein PVL29_021464 [Vitis rotundifolia]
MAASSGSKPDHGLNQRLYDALKNQNAKEVIQLCQKAPDGPLHITSIHKDTVLHLACYSKQRDLALQLVRLLPNSLNQSLTEVKNDVGNTILHEVATANRMGDVAMVMLAKEPMLLSARNILGETQFFRAVWFGKIHMFNLLADEVDKDNDQERAKEHFQSTDKTILHIAIITEHFDKWPLKLPIWEELGREKQRHASAWEVAQELIKNDTSWEVTENAALDQGEPNQEQSDGSSGSSHNTGREGFGIASQHLEEKKGQFCKEKKTKTSMTGIKTDETPLFLATTWSITELVEEILENYPQAVEHVNKKGRNILHVAIQYRQMKIFDMVTKNDMQARRLLRATDAQGNSLLHTVAKNRKGLIMETSQGPALDLQDQLLLFEKVKKLVKSDFFRLFNHKNQTAQELFADNYSKLHEDSKKWLEETSKNCTIVAVLIATVAFAAAYTVPGGNQQSSGIPVLLSKPFFVVFTLADVISLTFALTSVVSFLSILTSPFRLQDFKYSLPQKLMLAFTFLILSVTMMMVAFAATIILMIHDKESWTKIALYSVAFLPVLVFALSYSNLYAHLVKACSHLWQIIQKICPRCKGNRRHRNESRCMSSSNHPDQSHRSSFRRPSTPQITEV